MSITNVLAGVAVGTLDDAIDWYSRVLGRRPDQQPMPGLAEYHFPGGGWLQVFADKDRAGKSSITLSVDNLDAELDRLKGAGVTAAQSTRSDDVDTAIVTDPDGNQVVLAQAKSSTNRAAS